MKDSLHYSNKNIFESTDNSKKMIPAGFWLRFLACLIDSYFLLIICLIVNILLQRIFNIALPLVISEGDLKSLVLFGLISLLYYSIFESSKLKATLGKKLLGIYVADHLGARLSFINGLSRNILKSLSTLTLCVGYVMAGFTKRKQALHDLPLNFHVIRQDNFRLSRRLLIGIPALILLFIIYTRSSSP